MKARVLSPAVDEIVEAAQWLESQRVGLGAEFRQAVDQLLLDIERAPYRFAKSEFAKHDVDLRFALMRRFNYVVHFKIATDEIPIAAVAHGSRRPGYWIRRVRP